LAWSALDIADALADPIAFRFGDRGKDREHQLRDAVAGDVAAEVDHVQADLARLQLLQHFQGVERAAEHAVELGGEDDVAGGQAGQQAAAFRALGQRSRA
jgi:hypothetical protein